MNANAPGTIHHHLIVTLSLPPVYGCVVYICTECRTAPQGSFHFG